MSQVKFPEQADQGRRRIEFAERGMAALMTIRSRFSVEKPFKGLTIGMALHITKETAVLIRTLRDGGARVVITGCNPLSTQDDVAAALAEEDNISVFGHRGETDEDYYKFLRDVLDANPQIIIDDGADLVVLAHQEYPLLLAGMLGGCEETTTGVQRLRAMKHDETLKVPVIAVNDNKTKHLMDNYYGTGQSTIDGLLRATNVLLAGKTLVIAGYGSCGKGLALRARGMGANVIITEVDPFAALQAKMDGCRVMSMHQAASEGDIFVTVTGNIKVLNSEHFSLLKDGAILANAGHFNTEIDLENLEMNATTKRQVRPNLEEYTFAGRKIFLVGEGRLVNLVAAEGHPSEVMSLSFCGQALACEYLVRNMGKLASDVITLPEEIDDAISTMQLTALGVVIDQLTDEQKHYLSSWQQGT
jgi:adenosylhomocysteinase